MLLLLFRHPYKGHWPHPEPFTFSVHGPSKCRTPINPAALVRLREGLLLPYLFYPSTRGPAFAVFL